MHVAEQAVEEFLRTIQHTAYSGRSGKTPQDLAELLGHWLSFHGMIVLGESYENFLHMVIILLTDPKFAKGIEFLVLPNSHKEKVQRPKAADWVKKVGRDVFDRALVAYRYEQSQE